MAMPDPEKSRFRFGAFELDVTRGTLTRHGAVVPLRPKCFRVLQYLVERHGCLVTRDELLGVAWPRRIVTDGAVAKCMADIRAALDDHAQAIVRTVHGRGYRFEALVEEIAPAELEPREIVQEGAPARADTPVTTATAVVWPARASRQARRVLALATLAVAIGACAVLLDGVPPRIDSPHGTVANGAGVVSCSGTAANSVAGCDAVRSARYFLTRREPGDLERAARDFRLAIDANPALADGWSGLASVYSVQLTSLGRTTPPPQLATRQLEAIHKALEANPRSPEALARYAQHLMCHGREEEGRRVLQRALVLGPNDPVPLSIAAGNALAEGRFDEAIALQTRAAAAGPISSLHYNNLSAYLILAGRYAEARSTLQKMTELGLQQREVATELTRLLVLEHRYEEALAPLQQWHAEGDRDVLLAITYASLGRADEAEAVMTRLATSDAPQDALRMGEIYAQRGDIEQARHWVQEAERRWAATSDSAKAITADAVMLSPYLAPVRDWLIAAAPDRNG